MTRFLTRTFLFLFGSFTVIFATIFLVNKAVGKANYFKIDPSATSIIMGPSFPEYAFNDSLIDHFENFAQGGEAYFYTYYKLKKIIANNPGVQNLFIEYSNNMLDKEMDDWLWGDEFIAYRYPKYGSVIDLRGLALLCSRNTAAVVNAASLLLKFNVDFLVTNKQNYIKAADWGGYRRLGASQIDSLEKAAGKKASPQKPGHNQVSATNIRYLEKIIQYCKEQHIHVYFMRSPLHKEFPDAASEAEYRTILLNRFPGIELLDFRNFPLANSDFKDFAHLNYKGAAIFSIFFNELIKDGLLHKTDKQTVINNAISTRNKSLIN
jgi:hypothetical protein